MKNVFGMEPIETGKGEPPHKPDAVLGIGRVQQRRFRNSCHLQSTGAHYPTDDHPTGAHYPTVDHSTGAHCPTDDQP